MHDELGQIEWTKHVVNSHTLVWFPRCCQQVQWGTKIKNMAHQVTQGGFEWFTRITLTPEQSNK
jgi:hypothetical protein